MKVVILEEEGGQRRMISDTRGEGEQDSAEGKASHCLETRGKHVEKKKVRLRGRVHKITNISNHKV